MPRSAVTRSCSIIFSSPVAVNSACAGEVVPQNGQISNFFAGSQRASPPQDGHENLCCAVADLMMGGWSGMGRIGNEFLIVSCAVQIFLLNRASSNLRFEKLIQRRLGHAPGRADFFAFDVAFFQRGEHIGFTDAECFRHVRRAEQFGQRTRSGGGGG